MILKDPKRVITHGCSFTYGEELANPTVSSWPALVAKALDADLLNLAQPAYSNDGIIEDLANLDIGMTDLVIIGWTSHMRMRLVDDRGWFTTIPNTRNIVNRITRANIVNQILTNVDPTWMLTRWLSQVILMQSHLESMKCKWLMFNAFDNQRQFSKDLRPWTERIKKSSFLGWPDEGFVEWAHGLPKGPWGHPLEQGHEKTAQKILAVLKNIYDIPSDY